MSDRRTPKVNESWDSAAYDLFATGLTTRLGVDITITNSGLDIPDAALDDLCNAIMGDISRAPAAPKGERHGNVTS